MNKIIEIIKQQIILILQMKEFIFTFFLTISKGS